MSHDSYISNFSHKNKGFICRKDHDHRLEALEKTQNVDKQKAELITRNQELVENIILAIQNLLAHQVRTLLFPCLSVVCISSVNLTCPKISSSQI